MELICLCAYYGALMAVRVGYDDIVGPMLKHARSVLSCIRLIYIKCSLSVSPSLFSLNVIFIFIYFDLECFSSPEPKVSFSDHNLSIVHCYCPCKLFTFSSCPEPLGQFQPNSAQSNYPLLGWRGFKFVQIKGPSSFLRGDNYKKVKMHWQIQNQRANFN